MYELRERQGERRYPETTGRKLVGFNTDIEFKRNQQRYQFLNLGTQAFNGLRVVPSGIGIVRQVNLEYVPRPAEEERNLASPTRSSAPTRARR